VSLSLNCDGQNHSDNEVEGEDEDDYERQKEVMEALLDSDRVGTFTRVELAQDG
jgi:hypothetical protein